MQNESINFDYLKPENLSRAVYLNKDIDNEIIGEITQSIIFINDVDDYYEHLSSKSGIKFIREPIRLYINSWGGLFHPCISLVNTMLSSNTPVETYCTGTASSSAFVIFICGNRRFSYRHSIFMYHQLSSGTDGKIIELEEGLTQALKLQATMEEIVIENTGISFNKLRQIYNSKIDWYFRTDEALKLGVVDEIILPTKTTKK
jgi:ATP-dependent Clp protease protease subunit